MKELLPFASLLLLIGINFGGIMFFFGKLSERVRRLESDSEGSHSTRERVIALETKLDGLKEAFKESSDRQGRTLDNMSRQLATIATRGLSFHGGAAE